MRIDIIDVSSGKYQPVLYDDDHITHYQEWKVD